MGKDKIYCAVDLGTSFMRAAIGRLGENGCLEIIGYGQAPSKGIIKGRIENREEAQAALKSAVISAETSAKASYEGQINEAYCGISGGIVTGVKEQCIVSCPDGKVTEKDLRNLNEKIGSLPCSADMAPLEDFITEYNVDGVRTMDPLDAGGKQLMCNVYRIMCPKDAADSLAGAVGDSGVTAKSLTPGIVAASRGCLASEQMKQGVLLVSAGGGTTEAAVWLNGKLNYCYSFAVGGDHVSNDLSLGLGLTFEDAEELKKGFVEGEEKTRVGDRYFISSDIQAIMAQRTKETVKHISEEIKKSGLLNQLKSVVVVGGAASNCFIQCLRMEFASVQVYQGRSLAGEEPMPKENAITMYSSHLSTAIGNDPGSATVLGLLLSGIIEEEKEESSKRSKGLFGLF